MDPGPIIVLAVILVVMTGLGRLLVQLGLASDFLASLFVPPDRALGWPHGVQEQDTPWTWRLPSAPSTVGGGPTPPVPTQRISPVVGSGSSLPGRPPVRR
ncbi:MAG TPA: hypothetical protein VFY18_01780 [Candidatus Limnocylindrales bacterium]|nr:hypothetical protein [Candidatus Limnocylindrales bacterium]